jgi:xylan 1,4-beta-xylosidase
VTRAADGSLVVAVWNLVNPGSTGEAKTVKLQFKGVAAGARVAIQRVDDEHGDSLGLWQKMGSPPYPTRAQQEELRQKPAPGAADYEKLKNGGLTLTIPVNGLVVLKAK